jgi:serine/threonine-protein kinase
MIEMFQREARAAAQLNHPNIVTIYDVGTLNGRAYICMELVGGITAEKLIEKEGRLKVLDALRVAVPTLKAMSFAHSRNIIHRDIKPSNIMRNDIGVVKLMDFGLAKSTESGAQTTLIAGTPFYMPPEQFTGKNVNNQSDIFAIGATIYEMIAGKPPFEGMMRDEPPPSLRTIVPSVPKILDQVILRALEFDQANRWPNVDEMLEPIEDIVASAAAYVAKQAKLQKRNATLSEGTPQNAAAAGKKTMLGIGQTLPPRRSPEPSNVSKLPEAPKANKIPLPPPVARAPQTPSSPPMPEGKRTQFLYNIPRPQKAKEEEAE